MLIFYHMDRLYPGNIFNKLPLKKRAAKLCDMALLDNEARIKYLLKKPGILSQNQLKALEAPFLAYGNGIRNEEIEKNIKISDYERLFKIGDRKAFGLAWNEIATQDFSSVCEKDRDYAIWCEQCNATKKYFGELIEIIKKVISKTPYIATEGEFIMLPFRSNTNMHRIDFIFDPAQHSAETLTMAEKIGLWVSENIEHPKGYSVTQIGLAVLNGETLIRIDPHFEGENDIFPAFWPADWQMKNGIFHQLMERGRGGWWQYRGTEDEWQINWKLYQHPAKEILATMATPALAQAAE